jgi:hypothetical protein
MYPTLPSVSAMSDISASAPSSGLAPAFDAEGRRRYSGNLLQKAAPDRRNGPEDEARRGSDQDGLHHNVHQLAIHSPKVDPALSMRSPNQMSPSAEHPDSQQAWVENIRTIEKLREFIKARLEHHDYIDDENDAAKAESRLNDDAQTLYPVLQAMRQNGE